MERVGEGLPFRIFCRPLWRVRLGLVRIGGGEEDRGRGVSREGGVPEFSHSRFMFTRQITLSTVHSARQDMK